MSIYIKMLTAGACLLSQVLFCYHVILYFSKTMHILNHPYVYTQTQYTRNCVLKNKYRFKNNIVLGFCQTA